MTMGGLDSEADQIERFYSLLVRLNATLESLREQQQQLSQRHGAEFEAVRRELREQIGALRDLVLGIEHDVEEVRRDQTDPRIRIPAAIEGQPPYRNGKGDSGGALAIKDGKVKVALPASWVGELLKLGVSAGLGGVLMRAIQWLVSGH